MGWGGVFVWWCCMVSDNMLWYRIDCWCGKNEDYSYCSNLSQKSKLFRIRTNCFTLQFPIQTKPEWCRARITWDRTLVYIDTNEFYGENGGKCTLHTLFSVKFFYYCNNSDRIVVRAIDPSVVPPIRCTQTWSTNVDRSRLEKITSYKLSPDASTLGRRPSNKCRRSFKVVTIEFYTTNGMTASFTLLRLGLGKKIISLFCGHMKYNQICTYKEFEVNLFS